MKGSDTGHDNDACQYLRLAVPGMKGTSDPKVGDVYVHGWIVNILHFLKP